MAYSLRFYNGRTGAHVRTLNTSANAVADLRFSEEIHGSGDGSIVVKIDSSNRSFLGTVDRNSHFVALMKDSEVISSGVTQSRHPNGKSNTSVVITWYGIWEYLDEIPLISSFRAPSFKEKVFVSESNTSWITNLYAENTMRLVGLVFRELRSNLGTASPFWNIVSYGSDPSSSGADLPKSYELNSTEFSTVQSIISDLINDEDCDPLTITPQVSPSAIRWDFEFAASRSHVTANLAVDALGALEFEDPISTNASRSFVKTSGDEDGFWISNVGYDDNAAYSAFVPEASTTSVSGDAVERVNKNLVRNEKNIGGQVRFDTFRSGLAMVGRSYTLTSPDGLSISGVCIKREFEGKSGKYSATLALTSTSNQVNSFRRPVREAEVARKLSRPLFSAEKRSRKSQFQSKRGGNTGWRKQ